MSYHVPRRMPLKVVAVDLVEEGYPDFHAKVWVNPPIYLTDELRTSDTAEDRRRELMLRIFPDWDFVDEEGEPIPHTVEGFDRMSQDLLVVMYRRWWELVGERAAIPKASADGSWPGSPSGQEAQRAEPSPTGTVESNSPSGSDAGPGNY